MSVSKRAAAFMAANRESRVVDGEAYPDGGKRYVLENGSAWKLTAEDARSMIDPPRWLHD
jgi:hypothetical protein